MKTPFTCNPLFQSGLLRSTIPRMGDIQLYITLLLIGFLLIGVEIFVPGGILGIFGALAWIAAAVVGFMRFPAPWNVLSALALFVVGVLTFVVWVRYFPKSRIGKSLSLQDDGADFKSHSFDERIKIGMVGEALSDLRPSGIARFEGQRVDVVADGEWVEVGQSIKIISTSGGHISVVKV